MSRVDEKLVTDCVQCDGRQPICNSCHLRGTVCNYPSILRFDKQPMDSGWIQGKLGSRW